MKSQVDWEVGGVGMDLGVRGEYEQNILFIKMPKRERKRKAAAKPGGGGGEEGWEQYEWVQVPSETCDRKTEDKYRECLHPWTLAHLALQRFKNSAHYFNSTWKIRFSR